MAVSKAPKKKFGSTAGATPVADVLKRGKNIALTRAALKRNTAAFSDGDETSIDVVVTVLATNQVLQGLIEGYSKSYALSVGRSNFLLALFGAEDQTLPAYQIAESLFVTRGNVTFHLKSLIEDRLVVSRPDPDDGRYTRVSLAPRGAALLESYAPNHYRAVREATGGLSDREKVQLCGLLDKLRSHAELAGENVIRLGARKK